MFHSRLEFEVGDRIEAARFYVRKRERRKDTPTGAPFLLFENTT
jgi:hypothetical protein